MSPQVAKNAFLETFRHLTAS